MKCGQIVLACAAILCSCLKYRDFTLPVRDGRNASTGFVWSEHTGPMIGRGPAGSWNAVDVLNPSVVKAGSGFLNLYSGFDGRVWRTGVAESSDGLAWSIRSTPVLEPRPQPDGYIAANGSAVLFDGALLYYFQAGKPPRIAWARQTPGGGWRREPELAIPPGPYASWDERGVADPYALEVNGRLYLYYLGMDRAGRQRIGVATSADGANWYKLRSNPILESAGYGSFEERGLGEPAVWAMRGFYWMLYTARSHSEQRRIGLARSLDGVRWTKLPLVISGSQPWDSQVVCDPSVIVEPGFVRVWFGGGDVARPDENIHGQIGYGELIPSQ